MFSTNMYNITYKKDHLRHSQLEFSCYAKNKQSRILVELPAKKDANPLDQTQVKHEVTTKK